MKKEFPPYQYPSYTFRNNSGINTQTGNEHDH